MKREYVGTFIVSLLVLGTVLSSGCLLFPDGSHPTKYIHDVFMSMHIDYDEVAEINYTMIKQYLEPKSDKVLTYLDDEYEPKTVDYGLDAWGYSNSSVGRFTIHISAWKYDNGTKDAGFTLICYPNSEYEDPNRVEDVKSHARSIAIEIADVCNLTLNWDNAKWTVNYGD